jgi:hypothetical protein
MDELDRKIQLARNALNATNPNDTSVRAYQWVYLFYLLDLRFSNLGAMSDLTESINFGRLAISATSPNDPKRIVYLNKLAAGLADRYLRLGNIFDLDEAISSTKYRQYEPSRRPISGCIPEQSWSSIE